MSSFYPDSRIRLLRTAALLFLLDIKSTVNLGFNKSKNATFHIDRVPVRNPLNNRRTAGAPDQDLQLEETVMDDDDNERRPPHYLRVLENRMEISMNMEDGSLKLTA